MMEKKTIYLFWYLRFSLFLIFTVMMSDAIGCRKEAGNLNISLSWPSAISPPQQQMLLSGVIRIGSMPFFSLRLHSKVQPPKFPSPPGSSESQLPAFTEISILLNSSTPQPLWILSWFLTMFRRFLQEQKQEPNQCPLLSQCIHLALHTPILFTFS